MPLDAQERRNGAHGSSASTATELPAAVTASCSSLAAWLWAFQVLFASPGMPSSCSGIHSKLSPARFPKLPARQNQSIQHRASAHGAHVYGSSSRTIMAIFPTASEQILAPCASSDQLVTAAWRALPGAARPKVIVKRDIYNYLKFLQ